jgi:uncharacterized protein (TIGR00730 family)
MSGISSVCVYCGSSTGQSEALRDAAADFGGILARNDVRLVYGGGNVGLMGIVADAVLTAGGTVTGVIPGFLDEAERAHLSVTELIRVDSMHERKTAMFERSDAFVALPGGLGTLDEVIEVITWRQLGLHDKPILLADLDGYWQPLQALIEATVAAGFARPAVHRLYDMVDRVDAILPTLADARARAVRAQSERL